MTELSYRDKLNKEEGRKWNLLVLIKHHLQENGYLDSADMLEKEVQKVGQTLRKFEVCDNIDLMTILQEYEESYYFFKFGKQPKLVKESSGTQNGETLPLVNESQAQDECFQEHSTTPIQPSPRGRALRSRPTIDTEEQIDSDADEIGNFARSPTCTDPLKCYQQEVNDSIPKSSTKHRRKVSFIVAMDCSIMCVGTELF
jgi:hypothetical protein